MPENLELVDTEDLIKELQKRFESTIFCAHKPTLLKDSGQSIHCGYWSGGISNAIGLLEYNKYRLVKVAQDNMENE